MRIVIEIDDGELAAAGRYPSAVTITLAPLSDAPETRAVRAAAPRVAVGVEHAAPASLAPARGVGAAEREGTDAGPPAARGVQPSRAAPTAAPVPPEDAGAAAALGSLRGGIGAGPVPFVGAPTAVVAMEARTSSAPVADLPADDLTAIRGIGPAIADALARAGLTTYAELAASRSDQLRRVLSDAQLAASVESWPEQGKLLAESKQ